MQNLQNRLDEIAQKALHKNLNSLDFDFLALELFRLHAQHNGVYREWINFLKIDVNKVHSLQDIPFFPVRFFKTFKVGINACIQNSTLCFTSSSTTGAKPSKHFVPNPGIYQSSFLQTFEMFYDSPEQWTILALLPGYLERTGSSLVFMAEKLIRSSAHSFSGFYLNDFDKLTQVLQLNREEGRKTLLLGVSFGLLDFIESSSFRHARLMNDPGLTIMETGGMKGRRVELTRMELHRHLSDAFQVATVHSEYGMTELLSQAYSQGHGIFSCPPWMKFLLRETDNPLAPLTLSDRVGGVNIIDLANVYSCPFLSIDDLGRIKANHTFEVLGRFDQAEIRGCNLMVNE